VTRLRPSWLGMMPNTENSPPLRSAVKHVGMCRSSTLGRDRFGCQRIPVSVASDHTLLCYRGRVRGSAFWMGGPLDETDISEKVLCGSSNQDNDPPHAASGGQPVTSSARLMIWLSLFRRPGAPLEHRPEGPPERRCPRPTGKRAHRLDADATIGFGGAARQGMPSMMTHRGTRKGTLHRPLPPATAWIRSVGLLLFVTNQKWGGRHTVGASPCRGRRRLPPSMPPSPRSPRSPAPRGPREPIPDRLAPPHPHGGCRPQRGVTDLTSPWPHHGAPAGRA